jgi:MoaD family protein
VSIVVRIPGYVREFTGGRSQVVLSASPATVGEALEALWTLHPGVRDRVVTEQGDVRPHVNVFVGTESIRFSGGLATPLADGAEISIVPAVSGGSPTISGARTARAPGRRPRGRRWVHPSARRGRG